MAPDIPPAPKRQRIAKLMARAGLCSRRDAEGWIVEGRVSVNGKVLTSPAQDVSANDAILVDGAPLPATEKTRLFLFHKPRGLVTSDRDPEGRATVADYLHENWPEGPRVVTIGRLDINTEGLLLLTNDGGLARLLELPQTGWVRRYRVRAKGEADPAALDALAAGITIDGIDYAGIEAKLDRVQGANVWLTMSLREGKNREVKRVLEHIGLEVNRLIRLSFGPFQLLDLQEGAVEEVRTRVLRDQLGDKLAAQAGVDFGTPDAPHPKQRDERAERKPRLEDKARPSSVERHPPRNRDAATRPGSRSGPRRDGMPEAPPPKRERPAAGTRKHVSTLRAEGHDSQRAGPRKRIERVDLQDRRERTIRVERLVATRTAEDERPRRRRPEGERDERRRPEPREGRRDDAQSRKRHASPSAEGKRARIDRSGGAARGGDARRERSPGANDKHRPPRSDRLSRDGRPQRTKGAHDDHSAARKASRPPREDSRRADGKTRTPQASRRPRTKPPRGPSTPRR